MNTIVVLFNDGTITIKNRWQYRNISIIDGKIIKHDMITISWDKRRDITINALKGSKTHKFWTELNVDKRKNLLEQVKEQLPELFL